MDAFFVLSGFLITGILVDTRSRPDYFSNYYIRRTLRIFPLYYLVLLALFVMMHVSNGGNGIEYAQMVHQWGSPAWFTFYLGNFRMAYRNAAPPVVAYAPLWSLQIEEQFYLLFPLAVRWMRLEHLSRLLWCLVFLSPLFADLLLSVEPEQPGHSSMRCCPAIWRASRWERSSPSASAAALGKSLSFASRSSTRRACCRRPSSARCSARPLGCMKHGPAHSIG